MSKNPHAAAATRVAPGTSDDPAVFPTAVIGIVGINLLIAAVLALFVVFNRQLERERGVKRDVPYTALERYESDQTQLLTTYDWVSKEDGVVTIPIERAMEIVSAELNASAATHE